MSSYYDTPPRNALKKGAGNANEKEGDAAASAQNPDEKDRKDAEAATTHDENGEADDADDDLGLADLLGLPDIASPDAGKVGSALASFLHICPLRDFLHVAYNAMRCSPWVAKKLRVVINLENKGLEFVVDEPDSPGGVVKLTFGEGGELMDVDGDEAMDLEDFFDSPGLADPFPVQVGKGPAKLTARHRCLQYDDLVSSARWTEPSQGKKRPCCL